MEKFEICNPARVVTRQRWKDLTTKYGKNKPVVSTRVQEIVNFLIVRGTYYLILPECYERLSRNFDALVMMGEADMFQGFVISKLNNLQHVKT